MLKHSSIVNMLRGTLLPVAAMLAQQATAQLPESTPDPTVTYFASGIPTDAPIAGDYSDFLRPKMHFTPPKNFMNDPNGMHRGPDGTWHLYYQYNPLTPVAGNQVGDDQCYRVVIKY